MKSAEFGSSTNMKSPPRPCALLFVDAACIAPPAVFEKSPACARSVDSVTASPNKSLNHFDSNSRRLSAFPLSAKSISYAHARNDRLGSCSQIHTAKQLRIVDFENRGGQLMISRVSFFSQTSTRYSQIKSCPGVQESFVPGCNTAHAALQNAAKSFFRCAAYSGLALPSNSKAIFSSVLDALPFSQWWRGGRN